MLTLYYAPGACSLATQIALAETGTHYTPHRIDFGAGEQNSPEYRKINPHGRVPALQADGHVITENPAILSYIAERFPEARLIPESLTGRAFVRQLLSWFSGTAHTTFAHIFRPERYVGEGGPVDAAKATAHASLEGYFGEIEALFAASEWASLDGYSVADGYPFVFYRWARKIGFDMRAHEAWTKHVWRMLDRPTVVKALDVEGLHRADWISVEDGAA